MSKKIFILAPYPKGEAPSQRFRFEQYTERLINEGFDIEFHPFLNHSTWKKLYKDGRFFGKAFGIVGSFWRRFTLLFRLLSADYIFIHREASMIGPPMFEWIIAKVLRKKYTLDFDDATWLPNYSQSNAKFHRLKAYWKVKWIIKWANTVTAGNEYLGEYAQLYNNNVHIIPTTIDLEKVHNQQTSYTDKTINIGWTGTHTTMHYLNELVPILSELEKEFSFTFTVISNQAPEFNLKSLRFVKWNKETEIKDLATFNIGVMPLVDNQWAKGKCGFKGLQYMALGIPAILSPVGVNKQIIEDKVNGYLCETPEEWKTALTRLIKTTELRKRIGMKGREKVVKDYSVAANYKKYKTLFET